MKRLKYPQFIYALGVENDPRIYIGRTSDPEGKKRNHLAAPINDDVRLWMQDLKARGVKPDFWVLRECYSNAKRAETKEIKLFKKLGYEVLNIANTRDCPSGIVVSARVTVDTWKKLCEISRNRGCGVSQALAESIDFMVASVT